MSEQEVKVEDVAGLSQADDDAADSAVLSELFGAQLVEEGKVAEESKDEEPDDAAEDEEQPGDDEAETADSAYDAAVEVLKRDGWTAEDLRKLSKARVQAIADAASKRQADANKTWQQLQEIQKAKETAEKSKEADPEPATAETSDFAEYVETLSAELGDEAAGSLTKWAGALEGRVSALLKPLQEQVEAMAAQAFEAQLTEARGRVGERFPGLVDKTTFESKVLPKLKTLVATGEYMGKVDEALADAAKLAGLDVAESDSTKPRSNRRKGTVTAGSRQTKPESLSEDEVLERAALASITGDDAAMRRLGLG